MSHSPPETFVEVLESRAAAAPDQTVFTFLDDRGSPPATLSHRQLAARASSVGRALRASCGEGDRALLIFAPGLELIEAFFGCMVSGVLGVPVCLPADPSKVSALEAIVVDSGARVAVTTRALLPKLAALCDGRAPLSGVQWLALEDLRATDASAWRRPEVRGNSIALLQYTSGSTSEPRGVIVSHANLLANSALIHARFGHSPRSRGVIWLPAYHDMGLIGGILQPLYAGFPVTLMSPLGFLRRPLRWLETISRTRATTSGGPSFAYEMCLRHASEAERAGLDLSSWEVAFCGAEPVNADTLDRFATAFAPAGFRREAFLPCYGLAESTLMVTGAERCASLSVRHVDRAAMSAGRVADVAPAAPSAQRVVGCGRAAAPDRVIVVDPETSRRLEDDRVGEIWAAGPSVAAGYWSRPDLGERTFRAAADGGPPGPYLRTGDLGFLKDGELFVTGRLKDLIIVRGKNHYSLDIERTVATADASLREEGVAAFALDVGGEERAGVVAELSIAATAALRAGAGPDTAAIVARIRAAVADVNGLALHAVALLAPRQLPRTSSGKLRRQACRAAFEAGAFDVLACSLEPGTAVDDDDDNDDAREISPPPATPPTRHAIRLWLAERLAARLGLSSDDLDVDAPFASYGLDSAEAVSLTCELEDWLGRRFEPTLFWESPTIDALATTLGSDGSAE